MDSSSGPPPLPSQPRFAAQIPPPPFSSSRPSASAAGVHHRRAHSETFLRLPDDFLFDSDPDFGISDLDLPSLSDDNVSAGDSAASAAGGGGSAAAAVESGRSDPAPSPSPAPRPVPGAHLRSLSVDAAFFDSLSLQGPLLAGGGGGAPERKGLHRRSGSMDGSTSSFEGESASLMSDYAKKAMTADKLAELSLMDPKRAKRILANRQSAARSKERKIHYTSELERKVQMLQTESTTLSAQLTLLQRDTTGLTAENRELRLRLQALEQQAQLRDALNEALREEVQRLRIATGQVPNVNGNPFNRGFQHSVMSYSHPQQLPHQSGQQAQHQHPSQAHGSSNGPSINGRPLNDSMDFM